MKRFVSFLLTILLVAACLPLTAAAGFNESGGYTVTVPYSYTMETDEAVMVYQKSLDDDPIYSDIYTGSAIYVPIYMLDDDNGSEEMATSKQIKKDNVTVTYKVTVGERYIDDVSIVDGKKEKIDGLVKGMYVKIQFGTNYTGLSMTDIKMWIALTVNRVTYQESRVEFVGTLSNRLDFIDRNTVYGAAVPSSFKVEDYSGEVTFDMGDGIKYTTRVSRSARYTIDLSRDADYDIEYMYPDAYLQFYNFRGKNDTFASTGTLVIPVDTKKFKDSDGAARVYAYKVDGTRLTALGSDVASYDGRKAELSIKTSSLDYYVLSNQKLLQEVDDAADDTFQSGYLTRSEYEEAQAETTGVETATPADDSVTGTQNPETGGDDIGAYTYGVNENPETGGEKRIYVNNPGGDNPSTGNPLALMLVLCAVSGVCGIGVWRTKPFGKK